MSDETISAASIAKMAAKLGVTGPLPGSAKPRFPLPDLEIEDAPVDGSMHCLIHMIWEGKVIRTQNHTPGPELDAIIEQAQKLGFQVIRRPAGFRKPRR